MMASQFSKSCDSCQRNVTGCLRTCSTVQKASWSQFDPGKMMTPNFMSFSLNERLLNQSNMNKIRLIPRHQIRAAHSNSLHTWNCRDRASVRISRELPTLDGRESLLSRL